MHLAPKTQSYLLHMDVTRKLRSNITKLSQQAGITFDFDCNGNKFNNKDVQDNFTKLCDQKDAAIALDDFIEGDFDSNVFGDHTDLLRSAYDDALELADKYTIEDEMFQFDADSLVIPELTETLSLKGAQAELFDDAIVHVANLSSSTEERGVGHGCDLASKDIKLSLSKNGEEVFSIVGNLYESQVLTTNSIFEEVLDDKFGYGEPLYMEGLSGLYNAIDAAKNSRFGDGEEINELLFDGESSRRTPIFHPVSVSSADSSTNKQALSIALKALVYAFENSSKLSIMNIGGHSTCPIHRHPQEKDFSASYYKEMALKFSQRLRVGLGGVLLSASVTEFSSTDYVSEMVVDFRTNGVSTVFLDTK
jgi:hypothetical protein